MKVVRQKFAVGGLDQAQLDWAGSTSSSRLSKRDKKGAGKEKEFTDFDPTKKLRKGGKNSSNAFKSKKKYKRRK